MGRTGVEPGADDAEALYEPSIDRAPEPRPSTASSAYDGHIHDGDP